MATKTLSKKRRLINYLYDGAGVNNGITAKEAKAKFGISNLRATISDVKQRLEAYGNWEIIAEETANGSTRYFMEDTHPGDRMYDFSPTGSRVMPC